MSDETTNGIRVTVEDLATGDTETTVLQPGQHALICVEPAFKSAVQVYSNGTTQVTIKRRMATRAATA